FYVTGYRADRAFYLLSSSERDIGLEGGTTDFGPNASFALKMYPSEQVTLQYELKAYFPEDITIEFESGNENIVTINNKGRVTAVAEGMSAVTVKVLMDGKSTYYEQTIRVTVKDPYERSGPYLMSYRGAGDKDGVVVIPADKHYTEIQQYAFSGYEYVAKGPNDEISDEEPGNTKPMYIGRGVTIKKVVIPEGVKAIGAYAFAGLIQLEEVVIPTTCTKIAQGAFYGCVNLKKVTGLENVKLINQNAFYDCMLGYDEDIKLDKVIAIGNYAFANNTSLKKVTLPASAQSIGIGAFSGDIMLSEVAFKGYSVNSVKLGADAFKGCQSLTTIEINAPVISEDVFSSCVALRKVKLGKDVSVIGQNAFYGTRITKFEIDPANTAIKTAVDDTAIVSFDGTKLIAVAPKTDGVFTLDGVTEIGEYAFRSNANITAVNMPAVTKVGNSAFRGCTKLATHDLGTLTEVGSYAFANTAITTLPTVASWTNVGEFAFSGTRISKVDIPEDAVISPYTFQNCYFITEVTVGNGAELGEGAFRSVNTEASKSSLANLTIGDDVTIGDGAFYGAIKLQSVTLGERAKIGKLSFYNTSSLATIDLSKAISIGDFAFSASVGAKGSPLVTVELSSGEEWSTVAL
ncbi:MAG: leucine-rich repeat domain-containing protein, partial [Clostridia bacterium]|nr:leucine-rich repeat domain-containing protein [Clostridia bacterium]